MKFTEVHYNSLKDCVITMLRDKNQTMQQLKDEYNYYETDDRLLLDMIWFSKWRSKYSKYRAEGGYIEAHIKTAMKQVVKELIHEQSKTVSII